MTSSKTAGFVGHAATHHLLGDAALLHPGFGHLMLDHRLGSAFLFHKGNLFTHHRFRFFHFATLVEFTALIGLHEFLANLLRDAKAFRSCGIISDHRHEIVLSFGLRRHLTTK